MYRGNFQYRASSLQHLTIVSQENCFKIFDKFLSGLLNIYLNAYNLVGSSHPLQFYVKVMLWCVHDGSRQSVRVGVLFQVSCINEENYALYSINLQTYKYITEE
jgi:hypothetical protein